VDPGFGLADLDQALGMGLLVFDRAVVARRACLDQITIQLSPFLLGPPQLLHRGGEIEKVNGDDRGPGAQVCVADESIQLTPRLDYSGVDRTQSFFVLGGVTGPVDPQVGLLCSGSATFAGGTVGCAQGTSCPSFSQARELLSL
jgi:hypothetical protein